MGDRIVHRRFGYRGVVFDVDATFLGSDAWYRAVAKSRPPKDAPWYHVLVSGATHTTYVAERNLAADPDDRPVEHPLLDQLFDGLRDGRYVRKRSLN